MFDALDVNGDQVLDPLEIINGLKNRFGIFFSDEEMANMLQFIDSDFSGDIDFKEFSTKITMGNTILNKLNHNFKVDMKKQSLFIINKADFLNTILKEYKVRKINDKNKFERDFDRLDKKKRGELSLRHIKKYLSEDPNVTEQDVNEFVEGSDSDIKMNKEEFVEWAYKNGLYGAGKEYLGSFIFGQNYSKFKVVQKKDKFNL
jgi:Ca2+-binding EF-hand superfamily protein